MKTRISFLLSISFAVLINVNAQWGNFGPLGSESTRLIDPLGPIFGQMLSAGVGIYGTYPAGVTPSRLHVSDLTLPLPVLGFGAGTLFRTDGFFAANNSWSMFTGATVPTLLPRFNLTVPSGTSNLRIEANQPGSIIFFRNGPGIDVMQVNSVGPLISNQNNNVWIRKTVFDPFYDAAFLDMGGPIAFSIPNTAAGINPILYVNTSSVGPCASVNLDGFRMLYDFASEGIGNSDCMVFEKTDGISAVPDGCIKFTNFGANTRSLSMTIEGNGNVGCGASYTFFNVPWRRLSVGDSLGPQLRLHRTFAGTVNGEVFTDFETTAGGNLQIDPRNAGIAVPNVGRVRINYGLGNVNPFPNLSLEVNGQQRITTVLQDTISKFILVWDTANGGIIKYRNLDSLSFTGVANNGLSITVGDTIQFGQNINAPGNPARLLNSREIPMDTNNVYFLGQDSLPGVNSVGVGFLPNLWPQLPAKLGALDEAGVGLTNGRSAILGWNRNFASSPNFQQFSGVTGIADGQETFNNKIFHYGGLFIAQHSPVNYGTYGKVIGTDTIMLNNYAGRFETDVNHSNASNIAAFATSINGNITTGVTSIAYGGVTQTTGVDVISGLAAGGNTGVIVGGNFLTQTLTATTSGSAGIVSVIIQDTLATNFPSGLFDGGDVVVTNGQFVLSDSTYKRNILDLTSGLDIINQLHPVTFQYKTAESKPMLNLPTGRHAGLISHEVEGVYPSLVKTYSTTPSYDTLGVLKTGSVSFKGLNYIEIVPILVGAVQELYSSVTPFIIAPNAPVLLSPSNGASGDFHEVSLVWESALGGFSFYRVQLSTDSLFTTNIIDEQTLFIDTTAAFSIMDSGTYYWHVNARNNAGLSPWSQVFAFTNTFVVTEGGDPQPDDFELSTLSDLLLKQNVTPLTGSLAKVKQLQGVNYKWNTTAHSWLADTTAKIGMLANEVKEVYPEVVYQDDSSFYHIDYQHLVPPVVESIKELAFNDSIKGLQIQALQQQNDDLQQQINDIMAAINNCCNQENNSLQAPNGNNTNGNGNNTTYDSNTKINSQDVKLTENNICILNTNSPNPFNDKTIITYKIPQDARVSQIIFYNMLGEVIKVVDIKEKGEGRLNVFGEDLRSGMYSYTLIIDGNVCETKKMIKE